MTSHLTRTNTFYASKGNITEMHLSNSKRVLIDIYVNNIGDSHHVFSLDRIYKK